MIEQSIARLRYLCETLPDLLHAIPAAEYARKPAPGKWSKQEILGHLVDSAANNHHRFVKGQFEQITIVPYHQLNWNRFNFYSELDIRHLVDFWTLYNRHLLAVISRMDDETLNRTFNHATEAGTFSLAFLVNDYVEHLEHHLRQLVEYPIN